MSKSQSELSTTKFSLIIYDNKTRLNTLKKLWTKIENDVEFNKDKRQYMNHSERYIDACRKIKRFVEVVEEEGLEKLDEVSG